MNGKSIFLAALLAALFAVPAAAQAPLLSTLGGPRGYGSECLNRNDDGSSPEIDLSSAFPSGLQFFDGTYTSAFVNTNGNITFNGALRTFTPDPFPVAAQPMIAPYWADVDIRQTPGTTNCTTTTAGVCPTDSELGNAVWWDLRPGQLVVTWDDVGYFSCNNDLRTSFQLILTAVPSCGEGATDFDVEFRFNECSWETGDASGGTGGFGGTPAQSGFDAGNLRDFVALPGSLMPGIADALCTGSNLTRPEAGVWRFQIRRGEVLCPDAGVDCDTGEPGICAAGVLQCVDPGASSDTFCQARAAAADERCNSLDDDCDGAIDEGGDLCGALAACDRGVCVDTCFEGGCADGFECTEAGRCVEIGCEGVECPLGQRCSGGECVDACGGIVCPVGLDCFAGRCLDLCEGVECDPECTVCERGECIPRCFGEEDCGTDEVCLRGACEPRSCVSLTCEPGFYCDPDEGCLDACEGAVCPAGEMCTEGACVPAMSGGDMGPPGDMGVADMGVADMGTPDLGAPDMGEADDMEVVRTDGGLPTGRPTSGGCTAGGGALAWPLLLVLGLARRRRR